MHNYATLRTALAGLAYVGIVFAAGFVLGALRIFVLAPNLGEAVAVLVELPVMLGISWLVCKWLVSRFNVPPIARHRVLMGAVGFTVLMAAEVALSILAFERALADQWARYGELSTLIGLAGQIAFALFPLLQLHTVPMKPNERS